MRKILIVILLFYSCLLRAQGVSPISQAERHLLELVNRDTSSNTVAYLRTKYRFNENFDPNKYFVLVKSGRKNFFLLDGTNRVYIPDPQAPTERLKRIDSTIFFGDNFRMMALYRKDSIFQFGGYGYWNNRDFFTYYRPDYHDWEFYRGGEGKQSILGLHYYDRDRDHFYLIGNYEHNEHKGPRPVRKDSVYRYDFSTRKWETLGTSALDLQDYEQLFITSQVWFSPYGLCVLRYDHLELFDLKANRIYRTPEAFNGRLIKIQNVVAVNKDFYLYLQLGDTLHILSQKNDTLITQKLSLTKDLFETERSVPIFNTPEQAGALKFKSGKPARLIAMGGLLLIVFWIGRYLLRRKRETADLNSNGNNLSPISHQPGVDHEPLPVASGSSVDYFLAALSPVEQELVRELARISSKGAYMEIATMNHILGVSHKDTELQKVRRSNAITHINTMFGQITRQPGNFIEREKDPADKRVFQYYIPKNFLEQLNNHST